MAVGVLLMNPGGTREQYDEVSRTMFPEGVTQNSPEGLIIHTAGPAEDGWYVYDVWESKEAYERFERERLASAIEQVSGGQMSPQPQFFEIESMIHPGA